MTADLCVVGAGFTGLWAAVLAADGLGLDVVLLESGRIADGATGRNGGFCAASLTHGPANGLARWPRDMPALHQMGARNLADIEEFIVRNGIDCDWIRAGELIAATQPHQVHELTALAARLPAIGMAGQMLDRESILERVNSPLFLAALDLPTDSALVNPARLAWGLAQAAERKGVHLYEKSPVLRILRDGAGVRVVSEGGTVRARRVVIATSAYPPLLRRIRSYVVPVYDYVLTTRPLTPEERDLLCWDGRQGLSDAGNLFHYSRITADGRVLWGGYDAVYHRGNGFGPQFEESDGEFALLAEHFHHAFPQLSEVTFSHAWGGAIDTCSRFSPLWGRAMGGRVGYVAGFTGLGVGASRFAAQTLLDLLQDRRSEATAMRMVRTKPVPFPPEPLRSWGIDMTRRSLARADRSHGHRNLWLRILDRLGMGFDS